MTVSLLELSPSGKVLAFTLSERGGARFGVRSEDLGDVESGADEFDGESGEAGLDGLESCARTATPPTNKPANKKTQSKLRIELFYSPSWAVRNACRHLRAVSNSENRLPSCSTR